MSIGPMKAEDRAACIDELRSEVRAGVQPDGSMMCLEVLLSIEAIMLRREARDIAKDAKAGAAKASRAKVSEAKNVARGRKKPVPTLKLG